MGEVKFTTMGSGFHDIGYYNKLKMFLITYFTCVKIIVF